MLCTVPKVVADTFRENIKLKEGEALRDDDNFAYVAAWNTKATVVWSCIKRS